MIDQKEVIKKSVELMEGGCSLENNISKCRTGNNQSDLYIQACICYNYQEYMICLEKLLHLYDTFNKIDNHLFLYAFYQLCTTSENIATDFMRKLCKVHSQIKDLYNREQIETLNKALFYYVDKRKEKPIYLLDFLSEILHPSLIKKINSSSENKYLLQDESLVSKIDFSKIENKTIYNCYYNESSSGVGDFLRGCCYLFDLLNNTGAKFGISFIKHDISPHLKSSNEIKFKQSDIFDTEKVNKELVVDANYIKNIKQNILNALQDAQSENVLLFTNYSDFIDNPNRSERMPLTQECQSFMQKNLKFSKQVKDECEKILSKISGDYSVMHFRLGDRKIIKSNCLDDSNVNTRQYNVKLPEMKKIILDKYKETGRNIIVMSDSNELKEYVQKTMSKKHRGKIHIIHSNSQHCSNNPGFIVDMKIDKKKKKDNMFYVALDMKLITKSSRIYSYSVYPWGSGFVFWLAKIFNIPISTNLIGQ